jgi:DNA-binding transcriptional LysR family regulator
MNLRHLQISVAVADAGGLRRAAGRVHLSQPAISRQLHALEPIIPTAILRDAPPMPRPKGST